MFAPSLRRCNPMTMRPRGVVPDMLLMPTLQFGNPIQILVQMETNDFSHRPCYFCTDRFHRYHGESLVAVPIWKVSGLHWSKPDTQRDNKPFLLGLILETAVESEDVGP